MLGERVEEIQNDLVSFKVKTSKDKFIEAKCIIIAAGAGAFGPNKPPVENIEQFENKSIFYNIKDKSIFNNKKIAIAGGGDSAADWAIELASMAKKNFFHSQKKKFKSRSKKC